MVSLALECGWEEITLSSPILPSYSDWKKATIDRYNHERNIYSNAGIAFHAAANAKLSGLPLEDVRYDALTDKVEAFLRRQLGASQIISEHRFVSRYHGFGGCIDLILDNHFFIDIKTKLTVDQWRLGKMVRQEYIQQLAGYCLGKDSPCPRAGNLFVDLEKGNIDFVEYDIEDIRKATESFRDAKSIFEREYYCVGVDE